MAAKNHQRPPFRAEHMGSLLRPQELVDKRVAMDGKKALEITHDPELHEIEERSIKEIVKLQLDLGFHAVNGKFEPWDGHLSVVLERQDRSTSHLCDGASTNPGIRHSLTPSHLDGVFMFKFTLPSSF